MEGDVTDVVQGFDAPVAADQRGELRVGDPAALVEERLAPSTAIGDDGTRTRPLFLIG